MTPGTTNLSLWDRILIECLYFVFFVWSLPTMVHLSYRLWLWGYRYEPDFDIEDAIEHLPGGKQELEHLRAQEDRLFDWFGYERDEEDE